MTGNDSLFQSLRVWWRQRLCNARAGARAAEWNGLLTRRALRRAAGSNPAPPASIECWINGSRFAHDGVRARMTGAELRALPFPSIPDENHLWLEVPGGHGVAVYDDDLVEVGGRRFFTTPRFINAG